jgi:2'-5' RNA ligase
MADLAGGIEVALAAIAKPETRPFRAHLTVARSDPPLRLPADFGATQLETAPFRVDRVTVFRSHLRRPAPVYEPLERIPLGG